MGSAATSIPPLAAPPPPLGAARARAGRSQRPPRPHSLRVVPRLPESAPPVIAEAPARPARVSEPRPIAAPRAPVAVAAPALTFVVFRADGGAAKTIRLSLAKLALVAVLGTCVLAAALSLGWTIGEWTARL